MIVAYLGKFDALLIYANHPRLTAKQWKNLQSYVRNGGGFVPVHCASWCFSNIPEFDQLGRRAIQEPSRIRVSRLVL